VFISAVLEELQTSGAMKALIKTITETTTGVTETELVIIKAMIAKTVATITVEICGDFIMNT
jgi:hypothetical protein